VPWGLRRRGSSTTRSRMGLWKVGWRGLRIAILDCRPSASAAVAATGYRPACGLRGVGRAVSGWLSMASVAGEKAIELMLDVLRRCLMAARFTVPTGVTDPDRGALRNA
jgi:hypothetical protein